MDFDKKENYLEWKFCQLTFLAKEYIHLFDTCPYFLQFNEKSQKKIISDIFHQRLFQQEINGNVFRLTF